MALISCPECRREISDQAHACPGCGYPIRPPAAVSSPASVLASSGTAVKTAGGVLATWLAAPWIARVIVGVIALLGLFAFLIVGILVRG